MPSCYAPITLLCNCMCHLTVPITTTHTTHLTTTTTTTLLTIPQQCDYHGVSVTTTMSMTTITLEI